VFPNQTWVSKDLTGSGSTRSFCADGLRCLACAVQGGDGLPHIIVDSAARVADEAHYVALACADRLPQASPHQRLALGFRDSPTRDALGIMEDDLFRHEYSIDLLRMD
jgi:hypothetical protein